jgi:molecular chaperone IbpA|tara:strand:+ start:137 stop:553 length:417 start_codon:yes stop_codon:yes gene_type:complete
MTNLKVGKQLFPRSAFIGFDHLFNELEYATRHANDHYPPHNIVRTSEDEFVIEVAVAGFAQEEIDVEQKERSLTISGKHESRDREVIHRGISTKPFKRQFRLSEYVLVTGASLKDGILAVTLKMEIPKEKQPRSIKIT